MPASERVRCLSRRQFFQRLAACAGTVPFFSHSAAEEAQLSRQELLREFDTGFEKLNSLYWSPEMGIWLDRQGNDLRACYEGRLNPPWWSCANAVETMADAMEFTKSTTWLDQIETIHRDHSGNPNHAAKLIKALQAKGEWSEEDQRRESEHPAERHSTKKGYSQFNNEYLDDSGWWGIAWVKAHVLTRNPAYLESARAVQRHMDAHRTPDGGIMWNLEHNPPVTNSISNSLFLNLSIRLHLATREPEFLEAALKTRQWFIDHHLYDGVGIVDAPGHKGDYWSYNQGLWISGLLELHRARPDAGHLREAARFTSTLLEKAGFVDNGILHEKLSQKGWDTALFKAPFVRSLAELTLALRAGGDDPELARSVTALLLTSARAMLTNSLSPQGEFGFQWIPDPKDQEWNFNTHLTGLTLLLAAAEVSG